MAAVALYSVILLRHRNENLRILTCLSSTYVTTHAFLDALPLVYFLTRTFFNIMLRKYLLLNIFYHRVHMYVNCKPKYIMEQDSFTNSSTYTHVLIYFLFFTHLVHKHIHIYLKTYVLTKIADNPKQ